MNCQDLENRIFDYSEGRLSTSEKEQFDGHLGKCSSCASMLADIKNFESQVQKETMEEVNPFLAEKVISKIKNGGVKENKLSPALLRVVMVFVAGIVIGAILNNYLFKNIPENNIAEVETVEADDFFAGDENILSLNE